VAHLEVAHPTPADEWEGLRSWRTAGVNEARCWGDSGPVLGIAPGDGAHADAALPPTLAECGRLVLCTAEPEAKAALTHAAFRAWCEGKLPLGVATAPSAPARPLRPLLVPVKQARLLRPASSAHAACPPHRSHTAAAHRFPRWRRRLCRCPRTCCTRWLTSS
jgi:hypothetical protein